MLAGPITGSLRIPHIATGKQNHLTSRTELVDQRMPGESDAVQRLADRVIRANLENQIGLAPGFAKLVRGEHKVGRQQNVVFNGVGQITDRLSTMGRKAPARHLDDTRSRIRKGAFDSILVFVELNVRYELGIAKEVGATSSGMLCGYWKLPHIRGINSRGKRSCQGDKGYWTPPVGY